MLEEFFGKLIFRGQKGEKLSKHPSGVGCDQQTILYWLAYLLYTKPPCFANIIIIITIIILIFIFLMSF